MADFSLVWEEYTLNILRKARPNTIRLYSLTRIMFARFLHRAPTLGDLTDNTVNRFAQWRRQNRSPSTVNRDLCNLLAFWRWAHKKGNLTTWPSVELDVAPTRIPRALTRVELARLFLSASSTPGTIGTVPAGLWWSALLSLIWDTGERIAPVLALAVEDVDLSTCWAIFRAETRKGARADNARKFSPETAALIRSTIGTRNSGPVFIWPYSTPYIWKKLTPLFQRAGLPDSRQFKFHALRKSHASWLKAAGGNPTAALGHSDRRVTASYLDPRICGPENAVDLLFRPTASPQME